MVARASSVIRVVDDSFVDDTVDIRTPPIRLYLSFARSAMSTFVLRGRPRDGFGGVVGVAAAAAAVAVELVDDVDFGGRPTFFVTAAAAADVVVVVVDVVIASSLLLLLMSIGDDGDFGSSMFIDDDGGLQMAATSFSLTVVAVYKRREEYSDKCKNRTCFVRSICFLFLSNCDK